MRTTDALLTLLYRHFMYIKITAMSYKPHKFQFEDHFLYDQSCWWVAVCRVITIFR